MGVHLVIIRFNWIFHEINHPASLGYTHDETSEDGIQGSPAAELEQRTLKIKNHGDA